jgi:hypothetical protein
VSLILERFSGLETFIQKVFLLIFKWERDTSSMTDRHVSCIEETMIEDLESSRRYETSWEDSLISMIEEEVNQKEWDMDFSLVPRLEGKSLVISKLIYKIKHVADGKLEM